MGCKGNISFKIIKSFLPDYSLTEQTMRAIKKQNLPQKICPVCQRPFSWRKKWEKNWETVIYCSKACSGKKKEI
jgi:hypothetical protein